MAASVLARSRVLRVQGLGTCTNHQSPEADILDRHPEPCTAHCGLHSQRSMSFICRNQQQQHLRHQVFQGYMDVYLINHPPG